MSETPRLKVIGIAAGLALAALAVGFLLLSRGQSSSTAATGHTVVPLSQRANANKKAKKPARKAQAPRPAVKKPVVEKSKPATNEDGPPSALTAALARDRVVVVALYVPSVELDEMAMLEARAGAAAAGVGFVALNVLDENQSKPLTKKLGVLEDPSVLVFRRPDEVVVSFSGFADKEIVAQAARNASL
jgi:hypothetical protein